MYRRMCRDWFHSLRDTVGKKEWRVPDFVREGGDEIVSSFLRALQMPRGPCAIIQIIILVTLNLQYYDNRRGLE